MALSKTAIKESTPRVTAHLSPPPPLSLSSLSLSNSSGHAPTQALLSTHNTEVGAASDNVHTPSGMGSSVLSQPPNMIVLEGTHEKETDPEKLAIRKGKRRRLDVDLKK